ncbi:NADH:flavin oxidoreductase/NADH oxidase [Oryzicola mucosus]|uniref:NADH:flavin oxidoreductase/NADH oxidase n=1 Tax=Oryzicola mucosus TaxID=2767425 RepID=A0A8J6PMF9_9HYPH|nr:NADH:flavin oxidoreductase/NADH oxidase [Oryzicola mucosus]MBD0417334.1 NADH:flavin oxidoreductase/NADH oxidase [Oryzicola mucosus]
MANSESVAPGTSALFTPLRIRGVEARNRVMISPMQQYAGGSDGLAGDYHLAHVGRFALGGAGMVIMEATAIEPIGRNSWGDLGLWSDMHVEPLARCAALIKSCGSVSGIQMVHAGRKASINPPWLGGMPLGAADAERGSPPWAVIGPSAVAAGPEWPLPMEMSAADIQASVVLWANAARRAADAGFQIIDLHGAHGYLLHSFLSPLANHRTDLYGGPIENRMRYCYEVVDAIRAAIPDEIAIFYRLSALDGIEGGWTLDDSVVFCRGLLARGVDVIDCSSGGATGDRKSDTRIRRGYAFHAPYSRVLRAETGGLVATVGLIVDPFQAEAILEAGDADIVAIGREALFNPNWPHHARNALSGENFSAWNKEAGWWLKRRGFLLRELENQGETPMSRYSGQGDGQ